MKENTNIKIASVLTEQEKYYAVASEPEGLCCMPHPLMAMSEGIEKYRAKLFLFLFPFQESQNSNCSVSASMAQSRWPALFAI